MVIQCDHMPLIDEADTLLDFDLMNDISNEFFFSKGLILDKNGNQWYLWRADALESWWRFFEELIDAPMGRKLVNSACDEEENLLDSTELDFTGIFRKKKALKALQQRWRLRGWGIPYLNPPSFDSNGLAPIFAGILQADIERINSKRYRMLWQEKSAGTTLLTLNETNSPITAPKSSTTFPVDGEQFKIEVENGWKIDGLDYFLLPAGLFNRLEESCTGLVANIGEDERRNWPEVGDGFLSMAIASKKLFIAGEELFLAADLEGWIDSCRTYFGSKGMSVPDSIEELDSNGGIKLKFSEISTLSLTVGNLAGAWVRCEGRPVKVGIESDGNFHYITLKNRYELS